MNREELEIKEENTNPEIPENQEEKVSTSKAAFIIVAVVMVLFLGVLLFTDILGNALGKTAENVGLVVIALILAAMLYKTNKK